MIDKIMSHLDSASEKKPYPRILSNVKKTISVNVAPNKIHVSTQDINLASDEARRSFTADFKQRSQKIPYIYTR